MINYSFKLTAASSGFACDSTGFKCYADFLAKNAHILTGASANVNSANTECFHCTCYAMCDCYERQRSVRYIINVINCSSSSSSSSTL